MKHVVFSILAIVPLALFGWILREGRHAPGAYVPASSAASSAARPSTRRVDPADKPLLAFFDGEPGGFKLKGQVSLYDEKTLFDYIDGAAPLYIERKFRKLAAGEMTGADGAELTCDVYDMREAENAASIFFEEKSDNSQPLEDWPQAVTGPMSFVFRDGRYYVKLTAFDKKAEATLGTLARALKGRMDQR